MRLILVRHGDAHAGFHGVIGGERGCAGLTDTGRAQAEALRARLAAAGGLGIEVLLASVLPRAVETASIVAPGLGLEIADRDCDLCELHTGEADGLTWTDYADRFGSFDMEVEPDRVFAPSGDSWRTFHERVRQVVERLARDHADRTVMAVCHAGVIVATLRELLDLPGPAAARLRPTNTGMTVWDHDPVRGEWALRGFDDAAHLERAS